jgi:glucose-6-phosphate 1-dehydrogenase
MSSRPGASIITIFGAAGDLTWRKLVPALYNLHLDRLLPEKIAVVGIDKQTLSQNDFHNRMQDGIDRFSRRGKTDEHHWEEMKRQLSYIDADFSDPVTYKKLSKTYSDLEKAWGMPANHISYLAVPPLLIETIVRGMGRAGLAKDRLKSRVVVEKPFGHDYDSAHTLNKILTEIFDESQIYRIDHYLGKETVQNILAFRFANALFEPVWDRRYIDHVQITVAEEIGVEHRGPYYEQAGALRDMIQNHLFQILCLIAMEPMVSFDADEIRNKKLDVLRAIRRIPEEQVQVSAVRGQYGEGWLEGKHVIGYRDEPGVSSDSRTETFAAVKLFVDNWRWQDVPFYLRTGKRLPVRVSEVTIQFMPVPHQSFPVPAALLWQPNRMIIRIQPDEGIVVRFQAKQPGPNIRLSPVDMLFSYQETFKTAPPEAYETLLLDVMRGDATLFMRADQAENAWSVLMPILQAWESAPPIEFPNYAAGSWGPESSEALIARDGRSWHMPSIQNRPKVCKI